MLIKRDAVEFNGTLKFYQTAGESGTKKTCAFCSECGVRLYHDSGGDIISIKAGTLDDTSQLSPSRHIWTKRAQPWLAKLLPEYECHPGEPPE